MARTTRQQRVYADLLNRHGRAIADAFFKAIDELKSAVQLQRVTAALENGDIEAALEALSLDPAVYNDLLEKVRATHMESGEVTALSMPKRTPAGVALTIRFDGRNFGAERILAEQSSKLITRLTQEQVTLARTFLTEGMARGDNPRRVALDLVGRVSRATGKRTGGVLGLSAPQEAYVASARAELASSDPALLRHYLTRARRDRRFDRTVTKAIREGKAIPRATADNMVTAYSNRLLKLRGDVIGMHEAFSAMEGAKLESYRQAVASGKLDAAVVTKTWRHFDNKNPRNQHIEADGQTVGLEGVFIMPDGTAMRHPHDPSAPVSHTAGCHCQTDFKIDFLAGLR